MGEVGGRLEWVKSSILGIFTIRLQIFETRIVGVSKMAPQNLHFGYMKNPTSKNISYEF